MSVMKYTMSRRYDNVVLETGVVSYFEALKKLDNYPNCDINIHPDGTDGWEYSNSQPVNNTQDSWAYL